MAAGDLLVPTDHSRLLGENAGSPRLIGCNADGMLHTHPWSQFGVTQDLTLNDSDKTFTVPANQLWIIWWIAVNYTATAVAGGRTLVVDLQDPTPTIATRFSTGTDIAANNLELIHWGQGNSGFVDATGQVLSGPMPTPLILEPAWSLRVYDLQETDPAADDMLVSIGHQEIDNT